MSRMRFKVTCPTCGAGPDEHCRTTFLAMHPGRITDTHHSRYDAAAEAVERNLREARA